MSHLSTAMEVLTDEIHKVLKPKLIADGYYGALLHALEHLNTDLGKVFELAVAVRLLHFEHHVSGPLSLCDPICRMVDKL